MAKMIRKRDKKFGANDSNGPKHVHVGAGPFRTANTQVWGSQAAKLANADPSVT